MYDPERDDDRGPRAFYRRIAVVVGITAIACLALWPSISGYDNPDQTRACMAIRDGWHADHTMSDAQLNSPTADPVAVSKYYDWQQGDGACVPEGRHRLILSGTGLAILAGAVTLAFAVRRRIARTRNGRPEGRPEIALPLNA